VTYVQTPGADPARIAAMMSKIIDAALLNPTYYKHAVAGGMKILANMAEMDIPIQHIGLVISQKFVAANPELNPPHREVVSRKAFISCARIPSYPKRL
jgi:hypothetical protein